MHSHSLASLYVDTLPLLDEEFDKGDIVQPAEENMPLSALGSFDELAWDDQLDNGEEMSLYPHVTSISRKTTF